MARILGVGALTGSFVSDQGSSRYGESPPERSLKMKAPTMKASRIDTAIEVTGLTTMKIVRE